jgi:hypothetical protein
MTAQIPDTFIYQGEEYALVGIEGGGLLKPKDFGLQPIMMHTACYRGYYCTYRIAEDGLFLTHLVVRTRQAIYPPIEGREAVMGNLDGVYSDLKVLVPFTGKLRLAKDFIRELYIHMGFQKPSAFKTILDLSFEGGHLGQITDLSAYFAEMRGSFKDRYYGDGDMTRSINDAFSLDIDVDS